MHEELNQLIQECCRGNRQSQSRLYSYLSPKMFVVCQRYSKSREEAEETLHEGFVKMFEHLHQYKFAGAFEGWVRKIMVNCALQKFRKKTHLHAVVNIEENASQYSDNENISAQLSAKELMQLVQKLPPAYQMVFNLYVFEGMKHREIAELLGISEGTSKSNLSDARTILQKAVIKNSQIASPKTNSI
jgi:RNA polymerase sigma-70 factor (ECF subfamily)